jgi:hypothetical protein
MDDEKVNIKTVVAGLILVLLTAGSLLFERIEA